MGQGQSQQIQSSQNEKGGSRRFANGPRRANGSRGRDGEVECYQPSRGRKRQKEKRLIRTAQAVRQEDGQPEPQLQAQRRQNRDRRAAHARPARSTTSELA